MPKPIVIFAVVSVSLHTGLLMVWPSDETNIAIGSPFQVSIVAAREQHQTTVKQTLAAAERPLPDKAVHTKTQQVTAQETPRHKNPTPVRHSGPDKHIEENTLPAPATVAVRDNGTTTISPPSVAMSAQTVSLLRADLEDAFRLQFYYPRLAVRRGWQGEVRLGLRLAANGMLENIHILVSSGHGILDQAAMQSLANVQQLPAASHLLKGQNMALELPVQYRLL